MANKTLNNLVNLFYTQARDARRVVYDINLVEQTINDSYKRIVGMYEFSFREAQSTVAVAASSNTFVLPTDYDFTDPKRLSVYWNVADQDHLVEYHVKRQSPDSTSASQPLAWWKFADTGYLYPKPNAAGNLIFQYYKMPTDLTDGNDEVIIPEGEGAVIAWDALATLLPANDTNFQKAQIQRDNLMEQLVMKYVTMQETNNQERVYESANRIRRTNYW